MSRWFKAFAAIGTGNAREVLTKLYYSCFCFTGTIIILLVEVGVIIDHTGTDHSRRYFSPAYVQPNSDSMHRLVLNCTKIKYSPHLLKEPANLR